MAQPSESLVSMGTPVRRSPVVQAFSDTALERAALQPDEVMRVNLNLEQAIEIAVATAARLTPLLDAMRGLPVDLIRIERLKVYAQAATHAHAMFRIALKPPDGIESLYRVAIEMRKMLRLDLQNLTFHRLLDGKPYRQSGFRMGYRNVGYDLMGLVGMFQTFDEAIRARSAVTPELLLRAELAASQLLDLVATRLPKARLRADDERRRAFTLLFRSQEEGRRALAFLRFHERDAATIAPALHTSAGAGRPRKERKQRAVPTEPRAAVEPVTVVQKVEQHADVSALPVPTVAFGALPE